jgi:hypothetical protein
MAPTVTTAASSGLTLRDTTLCSAITSEAEATTGSTVCCGTAPWPPLPTTRIVTRSAAAMAGPAMKPNRPAGTPGQLCSP